MDGRIIDYLMQKLILAATARSALRGDIPVAITGAVAFTMTLVSIAFSLKTHVAIPSSSASRSPSSSMSGDIVSD